MLWEASSNSQRQACAGRPVQRYAPDCAWEAAGDLLLDWNTRVHPIICNLISTNWKHIYKRGGVQPPIVFNLYLISSSGDPARARPTIIIGTSKRKAAKKARQVLLSHDLFKGLNTNFNIEFEEMNIQFFNGNGSNPNPEPSYSICGASVALTPCGPDEGLAWRYSTILAVTKVGQHQFAIIPAHVLYGATAGSPSPFETQGGWEDDQSSGSSSVSVRTTDTSSDGRVGHDSGYTSDDRNIQELILATYSVEHLVYLRQDTASSASKFRVANPDPKDLVFIGCAGVGLQSEGMTGSGINRECDYALVRLIDPSSAIDHVLESRSSTAPRFFRLLGEHEVPHGDAILSASVSGVRPVRVASAAVVMLLPGSNAPQKVWQIATTLMPGDSGSPLVDESGNLIGMAVASVTASNITFVIPAFTIATGIASSCRVRSSQIELVSEVVRSSQSTSHTKRTKSPPPSRRSHADTLGLDDFESDDASGYHQDYYGSTDDIDQSFDRLHLGSPPRQPTMSKTRLSIDVTDKDYVYIHFDRGQDDDWSSVRQTEISAPQNDLQKKARRSSDDISQQLRAMTASRRVLIKQMADELTDQEAGNADWKPACIEEKFHIKGNKRKVFTFKVVFARVERRVKDAEHQDSNATNRLSKPSDTTIKVSKSGRAYMTRRVIRSSDDRLPQVASGRSITRAVPYVHHRPQTKREPPILRREEHYYPSQRQGSDAWTLVKTDPVLVNRSRARSPHYRHENVDRAKRDYDTAVIRSQNRSRSPRKPSGGRRKYVWAGGEQNVATTIARPRDRSPSRERDTYTERTNTRPLIVTRDPSTHLSDDKSWASEGEKYSATQRKHDDRSSWTSQGIHQSQLSQPQQYDLGKQHSPRARLPREERSPYREVQTVIVPADRRRVRRSTERGKMYSPLPTTHISIKPVVHQSSPSTVKHSSFRVEDHKAKQKHVDDYDHDYASDAVWK